MRVIDLKTVRGLTYEELSKLTGIDETRLYTRRFKNINQLTLEDAIKMSKYMGLTTEELYELSKVDVNEEINKIFKMK